MRGNKFLHFTTFFVLGGLFTGGMAFAVQGNAFGFANVPILAIAPAFLVGAIGAVIISYLVWQSQKKLRISHDLLEEKVNLRTADLRKSAAIFDTVLGASPNVLIVSRLSDGKITYANPASYQVTGYKVEESVGQIAPDFYVNPDAHNSYIEALREDGQVQGVLFELRKVDGTTFFARANSKIIDLDGEPYIVAELEDLSEEQTLQDQLSSAISAMPDGFIYFDKDDKFVVCNEPYRESYSQIADLIKPGNTFETMLRGSLERKEIIDAIGNEEEWLQTRLEQHRNPTGPFEQELEDGRHLVIIEYRTPDGGNVGIRRDITDRVQAERALAESKATLQDAIESLGDAFALFDTSDRLVVANSQYKNFYEGIRELIVPGVQFEDLLIASVELQMYSNAVGREEEWLTERLEMHRKGNTAFEQRLADGRWLRVSERRTASGGIAGSRVDITELKQAQQAAEKANAAKSEFLSSMSHELRTPMNAILGFAQILELNSEQSLTTEQKRYIDQILSGGHHLMELIDQVLELEKIEAGDLALSIERIQVEDLCGECLTYIDKQAGKRGLKIKTDLGVVKYIKADYTRSKQVLLNLLSNAVKYNREGGTITLACEEVPDNMIKVSITDTGEGIAKNVQAGLFKPFNRLGKESGEIEGTGIGLTITKRLIEAMGGRVCFESEVGKGSTFWIEIPAMEAVDEEISVSIKVPKKSEPEGRLANDATVLYIEDNPDNLQLMEAIIEKMSRVNLISAHNAELGLTMAEEQLPDLILMDVNLPGMDGITAMKVLRTIDKIKNIPVIAISGAVMKSDKERGMAAGFKAYLSKPFKVREMIATIEKELSA